MVSRRRLLKRSKLSRKKNRTYYRKKSNKKMKRTKRTRNQRRLVKGGGGGTKRVTFAQKDVDYKKNPCDPGSTPIFSRQELGYISFLENYQQKNNKCKTKNPDYPYLVFDPAKHRYCCYANPATPQEVLEFTTTWLEGYDQNVSTDESVQRQYRRYKEYVQSAQQAARKAVAEETAAASVADPLWASASPAASPAAADSPAKAAAADSPARAEKERTRRQQLSMSPRAPLAPPPPPPRTQRASPWGCLLGKCQM